MKKYYIPPNIVRSDSFLPVTEEEVLSSLRDKKNHEHMLIMGDSGIGKTMYMNHLYDQVCKKNSLCFYFTREIADLFMQHKDCIELFEDEKLIRKVYSQLMFNKFSSVKKYIYIFIDSFEEVFINCSDVEIRKIFDMFSKVKAKIIIGARRFEKYFNSFNYTDSYKVMEWEFDGRAKAFFQNFFCNEMIYLKFLRYLDNNENVYKLITTPINAYLMAIIYAEYIANPKRNEQRLDINNIYDLYEEFYNLTMDIEKRKFKCDKEIDEIFSVHLQLARIVYKYYYTDDSKELNTGDSLIEKLLKRVSIKEKNVITSMLTYDNNRKEIHFIHDSFIDFILVKETIRSILSKDDLSFLTVLFRHFDIKFFEAGIQSLNTSEKVKFKINLEDIYYQLLEEDERLKFKQEFNKRTKVDSQLLCKIDELLSQYSRNELKNRLIYCYGKVPGTFLREDNCSLLEYVYENEESINVKICAALAAIKHDVGTSTTISYKTEKNIEVSKIENDFIMRVLSDSSWSKTLRVLCSIFWQHKTQEVIDEDYVFQDWNKVRIRTLDRLTKNGNNGVERKCKRTRATDLLILYTFYNNRTWKEEYRKDIEIIKSCRKNIYHLTRNRVFVERLLDLFDKDFDKYL